MRARERASRCKREKERGWALEREREGDKKNIFDGGNVASADLQHYDICKQISRRERERARRREIV